MNVLALTIICAFLLVLLYGLVISIGWRLTAALLFSTVALTWAVVQITT
jgi:hypothetical protein